MTADGQRTALPHCGPRLAAAVLGAAFGVLIVTGCAPLDIASHWQTRAVRVDGIADEWQGTLTSIAKGKAWVGLINDSEYVYVCLTTVDRQLQRQIMGSGFTVWFDPEGGKNPLLGIQYPMGLAEGGVLSRMRSFDADSAKQRQQAAGEFAQAMSQMEIIGPGKDERHRLSVGSAGGLEARVSGEGDWFVYELRIPLTAGDGHPCAIGTAPGGQIGMRLETRKADRSLPSGRPGDGSGGGPPGGFGGGSPPGGGMPGGMDGKGSGPRPGGGMLESSEPLLVWVKVHLATGSDAAPI